MRIRALLMYHLCSSEMQKKKHAVIIKHFPMKCIFLTFKLLTSLHVASVRSDFSSYLEFPFINKSAYKCNL